MARPIKHCPYPSAIPFHHCFSLFPPLILVINPFPPWSKPSPTLGHDLFSCVMLALCSHIKPPTLPCVIWDGPSLPPPTPSHHPTVHLSLPLSPPTHPKPGALGPLQRHPMLQRQRTTRTPPANHSLAIAVARSPHISPLAVPCTRPLSCRQHAVLPSSLSEAVHTCFRGGPHPPPSLLDRPSATLWLLAGAGPQPHPPPAPPASQSISGM